MLVLSTFALAFWTRKYLSDQIAQQRKVDSAALVRQLHDRFFDEPRMRECRRRTSQLLRDGKRIEWKDDDLLVFFESMGLYTVSGLLDSRMVWSEFCWEVVRYHRALEGEMRRLRKEVNDSTLYADFDKLDTMVLEIDARERKLPKPQDARPGENEIKRFLAEESGLEVSGGENMKDKRYI